MSLIRFTLKNSLLFNLLTAMVLIVGILKSVNMRREAFPSVDFDIVTIRTVYPGASPREVEQYVTERLEEEIESVDGVDEFNSVSIEGMSVITVQLDMDRRQVEKDKTVNELQRAVDRTRDLPEDLPDPPIVQSIESKKFPVLDLGLAGDMSYTELYAYADQLKERVEELPDVDRVTWQAKREREYWVELNPARLDQYEIGLGFVIGALAARNINLPGGAIKTPDGEILVRTIGEVDNPQEIEDVVLRTNDAGVALLIRDVGTVRETFAETNRVNRTNGMPSIMLSIVIDSEKGDIIRMVDASKLVIEDFLDSINDPRVSVAYVNDMSYFVRNRLGVLLNNGGLGILLVLVVLLLFLSRGIAIVTAFGLPVAFLGALWIMSATGLTINLLTMFALIIVLGMLVDDAIIVGENIWQHYEQGSPPWKAALDGASEVFWPVTATILTTMAAFSPMLMVSGVFGKFMYAMPIVVMVALFVSLLESMLILPSHAYDVLRFGERWRQWRSGGDDDGRPETKRHGILDPALDAYEKVLDWTLRFRYVFVIGIFGLLVGTMAFTGKYMQTILFPASAVEVFFVRATMPPGTSIEETEKAFKPIEQLVASLPNQELKDYITNLGIQQNDPNNDPFTKRGSHVGQVLAFLTSELDRDRTAAEIIDSLREPLDRIAAEQGYVTWSFDRMRPGPPVGKPVAIRILGDEFERLREVGALVEQKIKTMDGTEDVNLDYTPGKDEVRVVVDQSAAAHALLTVEQISGHVLAAFEGQVATHVRGEGERIPVRVRLNEANRNRLATLEQLRIPNAQGILVPLRDVATFERGPGILQITRRGGVRIVTVTANVDERKTSSTAVNLAIQPYLEELEQQFPDVRLSAGGEFEDTQESMRSLAEAFVVAMGLIFLILATQFTSLTQPFVVMAAIPFGIIGVIWAFYLHGMPLSFLGFIGIIGLSGVVVNDSIVLVSFINNARRAGSPPFQAALTAGRRRFRAVWLTTFTTVFGLLPMVYGIGGLDKFLQPAAVALGYGLIFGTVLVLLFVPALYLVRIDIGNLLLRLVGRKPIPMYGSEDGAET